MKDRDKTGPDRHPRTTRRDFLKHSAFAMGALSAQAAASRAGARGESAPEPKGWSRSQAGIPGKIVIFRDPAMGGHEGVINRDVVEQNVHHGIRLLAGLENTAASFETLFPSLTTTTKIAIKVNCIGYTDTRWETTRGIVSGLALMLGGTYDVSNVVIFDNRDFADRPSNPYTPEEFTFGGNCPLIVDCRNNCSDDYYVYNDHRLNNYLLDYEYLINMPALKSHNTAYNQLTLALKNHYGSCCPSDLCDDITGMLTVNADANIKGKTVLVLMDALRATYNGVPQQPPQVWLSYPEGTPNTLFFSSDPVTNDYWGRETINAERALRGMDPKEAPWVEEASSPPYELGVSDPEQMGVIFYDPAGAPDTPAVQTGLILAANRPNPFRDETSLHLILPAEASTRVEILSADGRLVRSIHRGPLGPGAARLTWNGRNDRGEAQPSGVYYVRAGSGNQQRTRSIRLLR